MSEEQLSALLAIIKVDDGLQEMIKRAANIDEIIAIANEAEFDVNKDDFSKTQPNQTIDLSQEELEGVNGGVLTDGSMYHCDSLPYQCCYAL